MESCEYYDRIANMGWSEPAGAWLTLLYNEWSEYYNSTNILYLGAKKLVYIGKLCYIYTNTIWPNSSYKRQTSFLSRKLFNYPNDQLDQVSR